MAGKFGAIDPVASGDHASKTNMMDMWNESIRRAQEKRSSPVQVQQEHSDSRADLEQRVRNGQAECPTCASRTYKDQSGDTSVSFQAPKHISAATSGLAVMSHEGEHVSHEDANAREKGGEVVSSSVSLEYAKCPDCGRTYVAGGTTKTTTRTPSSKAKAAFSPRRLDIQV